MVLRFPDITVVIMILAVRRRSTPTAVSMPFETQERYLASRLGKMDVFQLARFGSETCRLVHVMN